MSNGICTATFECTGITTSTLTVTINIPRLIARIARTVQDRSYSDSDILEYINEGLFAVTGMAALPELERSAIVVTDPDSNYVYLPADYHNHLRFVYSGNRRRSIRIYSNIVRLREEHPLQLAGGFVRVVAVSGSRLHYYPSPAQGEVLEIVYHAKPGEYENKLGQPDYMPPHVGFRLLHAYCCMRIYDEIEDSVDGQKLNTMSWEKRYMEALGELTMFLGPFYTRPVGEMGPLDMMRL